MKRLVCLLLAMLLCMGAACAEGIEMGGIVLNLPAGWRVNQDVQLADTDGRFVTMSRNEDVQPQNIFVIQQALPNWESYASAEIGLMAFADLTLRTLMKKMDTEQVDMQTQQYITLLNGGIALKAVFTMDNTANGIAIVLYGGEMTIISATVLKEDMAQCEEWLDQMLLPLRIQEIMEVAGMTIGLPAGFQLNEDSGIYFNGNNEALRIITKEATAESVQAVIDEGSEKELLLMMTQMMIQGMEFTDSQVELIELAGMPAMVSSMDITANGSAGCSGTLAALRSEAIVMVSYLGNLGGQQAAADMLQLIIYPAQQKERLYLGRIALAMPQDFNIADVQAGEDYMRVVLSDQIQPELIVTAVVLSDDEKAMETKDMLLQIMRQDVEGVRGTLTDAKWETYEGGAVALHLDWDANLYGVQYAMSEMWMATQDQLIRMLLKWPDGDAAQIEGVLASMLPALSAGETVTQGNVTLHIPRGWQLNENVEEDGSITYTAANESGQMTTYYFSVMPDNLRGMIESMDVQTALEIYLAIVTNEMGIEGIAIEYAQNESGIHRVTAAFVDQPYAAGMALLLDGDAFWSIRIDTTMTEEEMRMLLDSVLEQVR